MRNPFQSLIKDQVKVMSPTGETVVETLPCIINEKYVSTFEVKHVFEEGQLLLRELPNGLLEQFEISKVTFQSGKPPQIPASFKLVIADKRRPPASYQNIINNISGHSARVNIGSTDSSNNQYNIGSEDVFEKAIALVNSIHDMQDREKLSNAVTQMKSQKGSDGYLDAYKNFMSLAANHVAVFAPIIPALAAFL